MDVVVAIEVPPPQERLTRRTRTAFYPALRQNAREISLRAQRLLECGSLLPLSRLLHHRGVSQDYTLLSLNSPALLGPRRATLLYKDAQVGTESAPPAHFPQTALRASPPRA